LELSAQNILDHLTPFLTELRQERIAEIVANRTFSIVPVLDGLYDRGNVNAVLRSAESMGYQQVHIIDSSEKFKRANRITQGADKWMDIEEWETADECLHSLKQKGYRILATSLESAQPIGDFSFTQPTAIVFGNEKDGVSDAALKQADARVMLPMAGFSQSYNISVAAALCLYHISQSRISETGQQGDLNEEEKRSLTAEFYLRSVQNAHKIILNQENADR
jgi:tRNA (guanosine-2'-O-)-methyltransferase